MNSTLEECLNPFGLADYFNFFTGTYEFSEHDETGKIIAVLDGFGFPIWVWSDWDGYCVRVKETFDCVIYLDERERMGLSDEELCNIIVYHSVFAMPELEIDLGEENGGCMDVFEPENYWRFQDRL